MKSSVERVALTVWAVSVFCAIVLLMALMLLGSAPFAYASSSCPNELMRTGPGANLPDCRAYEMVSPQQKNGGEVDGGPEFENDPAPMQAAADGEAATYGSQTPFPEANPSSGALTVQYLSRRGPSGWSTQTLTPAQDFPGGVFDKEFGSEEFNLFQGFSEDLSHAFLAAYEPSPVAGAPAGYFNPYLRDNVANGYRLLSTVTPPVVPPGPADNQKAGLTVEYAGMSADGSHVLFAADDALTPGALPGSTAGGVGHVSNLYEWSEGHLELVSVLPSDEGGKAVNARFGAVASGNNSGLGEGANRVISADGSRVIWTSSIYENEENINKLYMRALTPSGPRTVQVSASQRTTGGAEGVEPAHYWDASVDGSSVFFTSCQRLTDDSTAVGGPGATCGFFANVPPDEHGEDLYRYDANTGRLTDLSVDLAPGQTADVQGVLGVSEDGSYVYFVAHGELVEGAPSGEEVENIYLWHEGALSLVSTTSSGDYFARTGNNWNPLRSGAELLTWGLTRVSPDGRYLAFQSSEQLTGYDPKPVEPGACEVPFDKGGGVYADDTGKCVEVYEYDAASGRLTCASCNPQGLPPTGDSIVPLSLHVLGQLAGWQSTTVQQRYLLDDGRLFFDSTDELLPQASNSGKLNVYEYEPSGLGSCQRAGGCVSLISTGTSSEDSFFLDAGASGEDVFFISRQQLVAQDGDEALDLYDARVDGGFSAATPPPCGGEACRAPITPAPAIYGAPPSATFAGPGNPAQLTTQAAPRATKKKAKPRKAKRRSKRKHAKKAAHRSRARRASGRGVR